MQFNLKEWLKIYNRVHALGKELKEGRPDADGITAKNPLSMTEQFKLESDIKNLLQRSNSYLDQCKMRMPKPLWHYDNKDPSTWISDPSFKYWHRLEV